MKEGVITGRGKVSEKYKNWFNISPCDGSDPYSVNLDDVDFEIMDEQSNLEQVKMVMVPRHEHSSEECLKAKLVELSKLAEFKTYEIVDDEGQERISCTLVLDRKGEEVRA